MLIFLFSIVAGFTTAILTMAICLFQLARDMKPSLGALFAPAVISVLFWGALSSTYVYGNRVLEPSFWIQGKIPCDLLSVLGVCLAVCVLIALSVVVHYRNRK